MPTRPPIGWPPSSTPIIAVWWLARFAALGAVVAIAALVVGPRDGDRLPAGAERRREGIAPPVEPAGPPASTLLRTSVTLAVGETVVVGTSRVRGQGLIAFITAVPSTR